jgi:uncharacterized CHY-type Zn-finger protein
MRIKLVCPDCQSEFLSYILPMRFYRGNTILTCLHCHGEFSEDKWKKTEDKIYD